MRFVLPVFLMLVGGMAEAVAQGRQENRLADIFERDMLSVRVAYLETITGPARRIIPNVGRPGTQRQYRVSGCEVTAFVNFGQFKLAHKTTLGMLSDYSINAEFLPACLLLCGASAYTYEGADPGYSIYAQMSHADGYIEVVATAFDENTQALAAADKLRAAALRLMSENDIYDGRFFCHPKYKELGMQMFRNVQIGEITIGYDLAPKRARCAR